MISKILLNNMIKHGTLVEIQGLTSSTGQKLNGAHALVVCTSTKNDDEASRYPVLIYAESQKKMFQSKLKIVSHFITQQQDMKSIKAENLVPLQDQKDPLLLQATDMQMKLALQSQRVSEAFPFLEAVCSPHRWPDGGDNIGLALTYVELLRYHKENPVKALEAMNRFKDKITMETFQSPHPYYSFLAMYADICVACGDERYLSEALENVMKMDIYFQTSRDTNSKDEEHDDHSSDDALFRANANRVLSSIFTYASNLNKKDLMRKNVSLLDVQLRCAEKIYEWNKHVVNLYNLGASHSRKGDFWNGAKCYRRVLDQIELQKTEEQLIGLPKLQDIRDDLIEAQMQCPGMPLEHYHILTSENNLAKCVLKKDLHKIDAWLTEHDDRDPNNYGQKYTFNAEFKEDFPGDHALLEWKELPLSENDPLYFTREFLDSLRQN